MSSHWLAFVIETSDDTVSRDSYVEMNHDVVIHEYINQVYCFRYALQSGTQLLA